MESFVGCKKIAKEGKIFFPSMREVNKVIVELSIGYALLWEVR